MRLVCEKNNMTMLSLMAMFVLNPVTGAAEPLTLAVPSVGTQEIQNTLEERLKQKINIEYKDADLANVLRSMAWTYKLNLVTGPGIKGAVTINLKNVSLKESLNAILTVNGLIYSKRGEMIYITTGNPEVVEIATEVVSLNYLKASEAQNLLRRVLSPKGDIKISESLNSIIISDFPGNIQKIRDLIKKVDLPPRQVLIEAKILDITSTDLRALGVNWGFDYKPQKGGLFNRKTNFAEELKSTFNFAEQSSNLTGGQFVLDTLTLKNNTITATLDALMKDGKAILLASPSIAVLNGEEARIVIGERFPIKERTQTASGTTETTTFVDIGTSLRVRAMISNDGYITLHVHPEVSSLAESLDAGPRITTREADTTVRVKEGETLVIGGLIKQQDDRSKEWAPFLGKVPLIGLLFSRSERSVEQKELAVFITPRILRSREERKRLTRKADERERDYLMMEVASELGIVEQIFGEARALDRGRELASVRKDKIVRKKRALSLYRHIATEFPDSHRSSEALYRAGVIYASEDKDYKKAGETFAQVISDYPDSLFAQRAEKAYKKAKKHEKKMLKKKRKEQKKKEKK